MEVGGIKVAMVNFIVNDNPLETPCDANNQRELDCPEYSAVLVEC